MTSQPSDLIINCGSDFTLRNRAYLAYCIKLISYIVLDIHVPQLRDFYYVWNFPFSLRMSPLKLQVMMYSVQYKVTAGNMDI